MDIYSAEIHVKKLLTYVEQLADSQPRRMYEKSKSRLRELSNTCLQVVQVISDVLQDEALQEETSELSDKMNSDIVDTLAEMQNQLAVLHGFVSGQLPSVSTASKKYSNYRKKEAFRRYMYALRNLADADIPYSGAKRCAQLLWRWFNTRFIQAAYPEFNYNMVRLPSWIRDIVILYGHALSTNTSAQFESDMLEWLDSIVAQPCRFAVPYNVFKFDVDTPAHLFTLSGVMLWDVLMDHGLADLCVEGQYAYLYLSDGQVYQLCAENAPTVLDMYENYKDNLNLLVSTNITPEV